MNIPERRNYKRLDIELPVTIMVEGARVVTETQNLGGGGLFVAPCPEGLPVQVNETSQITIQFELPDDGRQVKIKGAIARLDADERDGLAIQFIGLPDSNHLAIQRFVKNALN